MSTVLDERSLPRSPDRRAAWLALGLGLAFLYIPTYVGLAQGLWREDEYAHGPLILAAAFWLAWRERGRIGRDPLYAVGATTPSVVAFLLLAVGLALYVVGRSQALPLFEMASQVPVFAGLALLMGGTHALRRLAFAFLILLFAIPLPGFVLESVATPLKALVSALVQMILQAAGYAVARDGVVLEVGGYPMLVADACSGLNSLYSLFALALVYLHLTGPSRRSRWALVLASVVPIAIAANVVRVLILVLVTVHFGEAAGQGAVHEAAGIAVFVSGLALLLGFDALVRRMLRERAPPPARGVSGAPVARSPRGARAWPAYAAAIAMIGAAAAAPAMKPVRAEGAAIDLEWIVPATFGDWRIDPDIVPVAPSPDVQAKLDRIYRQVTSRTYVSSSGERMMLTIAHGGDQSDALKAHRQEVCYAAQGFSIDSVGHGTLEAAGRAIPVTRMLAVRGDRSEPVTYWFTMGDRVVLGRLERLRVQLGSGLAGRIPDGMLVRISSISDDAGRAYAAQQAFAGELFAAMRPQDAARFVGAAGS